MPFDTDVWLPLSQLGTYALTSRVPHMLEVVARLKAGVTVEQARAEMEAIAGRLGAGLSGDQQNHRRHARFRCANG